MTTTEIPGTIERFPSGVRILSGGTRGTGGQKIKLGRLFELPLEGLVNPERCIFCKMSPEKLAQETFTIPGVTELDGWRRMVNIFTPHPSHHLIVPDRCWPVEKLQRWGGATGLREAFMMGSEEVGDGEEKIFLINVGMQAGQNTGHPHMHVFTVLPDWPLLANVAADSAREDTIVLREDLFTGYAGGACPGTIIIAPTKRGKLLLMKDPEVSRWLAEILWHTIRLGNKAFMSDPMAVMVNAKTKQVVVPAMLKTQDEIWQANADLRAGKLALEIRQLSPAFGLTVRIDSDGMFRYATYMPDLQCTGALERCTTPLEFTPLVLPWPHKATAEHLLRFMEGDQ